MTKNLVEFLGGKIWAESEGEGIKRRLSDLKNEREQFEYAFHGLLTGFQRRLEQNNPQLAEDLGELVEALGDGRITLAEVGGFTEQELEGAISGARREAANAFGNDSMTTPSNWMRSFLDTRKYLRFSVGYKYCVLVMCRPAAVAGDHRPVVVERLDVKPA